MDADAAMHIGAPHVSADDVTGISNAMYYICGHSTVLTISGFSMHECVSVAKWVKKWP